MPSVRAPGRSSNRPDAESSAASARRLGGRTRPRADRTARDIDSNQNQRGPRRRRVRNAGLTRSDGLGAGFLCTQQGQATDQAEAGPGVAAGRAAGRTGQPLARSGAGRGGTLGVNRRGIVAARLRRGLIGARAAAGRCGGIRTGRAGTPAGRAAAARQHPASRLGEEEQQEQDQGAWHGHLALRPADSSSSGRVPARRRFPWGSLGEIQIRGGVWARKPHPGPLSFEGGPGEVKGSIGGRAGCRAQETRVRPSDATDSQSSAWGREIMQRSRVRRGGTFARRGTRGGKDRRRRARRQHRLRTGRVDALKYTCRLGGRLSPNLPPRPENATSATKSSPF